MSPVARNILVLVVIACLFVAGLQFSGADFSSNSANPGNSLASSSQFSLRFASGSYTGNGSDGREITGIGFKPDVVLVKGDNTQIAVMRTSTMSGDLSKPMSGDEAAIANAIESLTSNGFTVGTHARVNQGGATPPTYYWAAFERGRQLKLGSYTGNGTSQSITGLGFQPDCVMVLSEGANEAIHRIADMTSTFQFGIDKGDSTQITSLDANGFSVGSSANANANGTKYHYLAFDKAAGIVTTGGYAGNGVASGVTGIGFQPQFVLIRANDTTTNRRAVWRSNTHSGDSSSYFSSIANSSNLITALNPDGFSVGTDGNVNASGIDYRILAVRDPGP